MKLDNEQYCSKILVSVNKRYLIQSKTSVRIIWFISYLLDIVKDQNTILYLILQKDTHLRTQNRFWVCVFFTH